MRTPAGIFMKQPWLPTREVGHPHRASDRWSRNEGTEGDPRAVQ